MALSSRIMIVESLCTNCQEETQSLSLTLLSRKASADFYAKTAQRSPKNVSEILDYARQHRMDYISMPGSGFNHKQFHLVQGTNYQLGDVVTEQQAFDFGYVEPHIDTVACRLVETAVTLKQCTNKNLTEMLRGRKLITPKQTACIPGDQLHVFSNELARMLEHEHYSVQQKVRVNADHPISLMIFNPIKEGIRSIGVLGFYVPKQNRVYEFMAHLPAE